MPELPEVESVRQCLLSHQPPLVGGLVTDLQILRNSVVSGNAAFLRQQLIDTVCTVVERHGKYLFFGFQSACVTRLRWMALHLRMTGRLFLVPAADAVARHTRFLIRFSNGQVLRFDDPRGFGRVWLVEETAEVTAALGPDALSITEEQFSTRLVRARRALKPLLLDQGVVAGIGNIYADEILFRAGLHPSLPVQRLTAEQRHLLYQTLHQVISSAVSLKGANIDGVFEAGVFPVAVYGRAGEPCPVCGTVICKIRLGQRGTHFCPVCQPVAA